MSRSTLRGFGEDFTRPGHRPANSDTGTSPGGNGPVRADVGDLADQPAHPTAVTLVRNAAATGPKSNELLLPRCPRERCAPGAAAEERTRSAGRGCLCRTIGAPSAWNERPASCDTATGLRALDG